MGSLSSKYGDSRVPNMGSLSSKYGEPEWGRKAAILGLAWRTYLAARRIWLLVAPAAPADSGHTRLARIHTGRAATDTWEATHWAYHRSRERLDAGPPARERSPEYRVGHEALSEAAHGHACGCLLLCS
jgi:hypothetical protein